MCLAVPAQIVNLEEYSAKINIMGIESKVNIDLIENPSVGDYILVHAGCAIQKIDSEYFEELQEIFEEILKVQQENE